jgi:O-antigen ligase
MMQYNPTTIQFYAFVISAVMFGMIFNLVPFPSHGLYYGSFIVVLLLLFFKGERELNFYYVPFVLAIILSLLFSESSFFFQQGNRFFAFLIIFLVTSPLVTNPSLIAFRISLFKLLSFLLVLVTVGSFIGFVLGIYDTEDGDVTGLYGMSRHSMSLSQFAGLSVIFLLNQYFSIVKKKFLAKLFYITLIIIGLLTTTLGGSRIALIGCAVGCLFYFKKIFKNRTFQFIKVSIALGLFIFATSSFWLPYTEVIQNKIEASENLDSVTASRDLLWQDRINEFQEHPFFGSGFASFDTNIVKYSTYNPKTGTIEPGSSWLFLLSSLGIFGFLTFLILFFNVIFKVYKNKSNHYSSAWMFAVLGFFIIHLGAEGYLTAGGEFAFAYFWLVLSVALNVDKLDRKNK